MIWSHKPGLPGAEYAWHEVAVRLNPAGKIDYDKITRKLLDTLQQQPELQASVSGLPGIRAAVKG